MVTECYAVKLKSKWPFILSLFSLLALACCCLLAWLFMHRYDLLFDEGGVLSGAIYAGEACCISSGGVQDWPRGSLFARLILHPAWLEPVYGEFVNSPQPGGWRILQTSSEE